MTRSATGLILLALTAAGCATTAFSPHFRDNNVVDLKAALEGVKGTTPNAPLNGSGKPMAFIVTKDPTFIIAYDLAGGAEVWKEKADVTSRIVVGKRKIFHRQGKHNLVARSAASGQQLWTARIEGGDRLLGITSDGRDLYYVTERVSRSITGEIAALVALDGETGARKWINASSGRLGSPTARGNRIFVPLRFQSMAIINATNGVELARIRSKEETLLWVHSSPVGLVYGGKSGVYHLDEKSVAGSKKGSTFIDAALPKSVRPAYWWDGYNAALSGYTAYDRNRLLWQLDPGRATFLDKTIYVHNYRFFFAFDSSAKDRKKSNLRWTYSFPRHDVVASTHTGKSLVLMTDHGHLIVLDPRVGLPVKEVDLKLSVRGVTFDAGGYTAGQAKGEPDLRSSLSKVIWDPDRRFGAVKLFCVEELARLPGGDVSRDLVRIVTHENIDKEVYKRTGDVIVSRHDKKAIPLYLETLKSRYDFIRSTRGRAVDIMARALGDLKAKAALKPLLMHLADHETSLKNGTVLAIVRALTAIGDKSILEPFRDFLLTYRCDPQFAKNPAALNDVAEALLKMGGADERQLLSFVENDPHSLKPLRIYLDKALQQSKPGAVPSDQDQPKAPAGPVKKTDPAKKPEKKKVEAEGDRSSVKAASK